MWAIGSIKEDYLGYVVLQGTIDWPRSQTSRKAVYRIRNLEKTNGSKRLWPRATGPSRSPLYMAALLPPLEAKPIRLDPFADRVGGHPLLLGPEVLPISEEEAVAARRPGFGRTATRTTRGPIFCKIEPLMRKQKIDKSLGGKRGVHMPHSKRERAIEKNFDARHRFASSQLYTNFLTFYEMKKQAMRIQYRGTLSRDWWG